MEEKENKSLEEPEEKEQTISQKQETEMQSFLKKYGFTDVAGGPAFKIGGHQIDACGGVEDTFVVIECKTAKKREKKSIREQLQKFKGAIPSITEGLKIDPKYAKYKYYSFVIYLKNIEHVTENKDYAKQNPEVEIWSEEFIEYYNELYLALGDFAKYNFFGEIKIPKKVVLDISAPAFKLKTHGYNIYYFVIDPRKLLKAAYVARRDVGKEKYYQRLVTGSRLEKIARFIDDGGFFPNNVVVGFDPDLQKPKFQPVAMNELEDYGKNKLEFGVITFPNTYRSCWIIDGQHRLYAYSKAKTENAIVGVVAFETLPREKQAQFFIEINKEQKKVPTDLIWDLEGEMRPDSNEGKISNIVKEINTLPPLEKRIYIPFFGPKTKNQLKMSGLCMAIDRAKLVRKTTASMTLIEQKNPYYSEEPREIIDNVSLALSSFFEIINKKFQEEKYKKGFLFTNGGIAVTILLFEKIVETIIRQKKKVTDEELSYYLSLLEEVFEERYSSETTLSRLRKNVTSNAGKDEIIADICEAINSKIPDKKTQIEIKTRTAAIKDAAGELEGLLRKTLKHVLSKDDRNYFKRIIPGGIQAEAKKQKERDVAKNPSLEGKDTLEWLSFGELVTVVFQNNVYPKIGAIFVNENYFVDKAMLHAALLNAITVRNKTHHDTPEHLTKANVLQFNHDAPMIKKSIEEYLRKNNA